MASHLAEVFEGKSYLSRLHCFPSNFGRIVSKNKDAAYISSWNTVLEKEKKRWRRKIRKRRKEDHDPEVDVSTEYYY